MHDSTYVPMLSLTCTYVPMLSLTCTYVPISSLTCTYVPMSSLTCTYVPISSLTCTYVPISSLTCTYVPISSYFDICTVRQKYLKHENAQLTFKPNLIKAPKHVIARYKGSKGKLVAVFFQFYCIGVSSSSLCATSYFYFIFLLDMICQYLSVHILILNTI